MAIEHYEPHNLFNGEKLPKINKGQEALYLLICKKIKAKKKVEYDELMEIYKSSVQMSEYTSDNYWDNEKGDWGYKTRLHTDFEINYLMQSWLLRALGSLIKKGYLMVLPMIEFTKNQKHLLEVTNETSKQTS